MEIRSDGNVRSFEKEAFRKRLERMAAASEVADADFADAVYTSVTAFGLSEDEFRDTFGVSRGAVERWSAMQNLPQPAVRPKIMAWVLKQIL